jgi:hypothetical protein
MENLIYKYRVERNGKIINTETNRCLKLENVRGGYERVALSNNGKVERYFVHRLVAMVYLPNPEFKTQINHKNSIRNDNRVDNLEWCTPSENMKHGYHSGKNNMKYGNEIRKKPVIATNSFETLSFNSISDGAKFLITKQNKKLSRRNIKNYTGMIIRSCKGKKRTAYSYNWEYA